MATIASWLVSHLPVFGVVAFSLASVWSLFHLFAASARHPTDLFWAPATLVELVTAWLVYNLVVMVRKVTMSNVTKQDRRFYAVMLALNLVLVVPTLGASVWANSVEFGGLLLGSLFPVASVACAVAVAIPDAVRKRENHRRAELAEKREKRERAERERKTKEARRREVEAKEEAARLAMEATRKEREAVLESLGNAAATYRLYLEAPGATQAEIAEKAGTTKRTIRNHLNLLEAAGLVRRGSDGLELLHPGNGTGPPVREEREHGLDE